MLSRLLLLVVLGLTFASAVSFERILFAHRLAYFEKNLGQTDPAVRYLARGAQRISLTGDSLRHVTDISGPVDVQFRAAGSDPQIETLEPWPGVVNRFEGQPDQWRRNIPAFERLRYQNVQPGVDLIFSQEVGVEVPGTSLDVTLVALKLSFVVQPGGHVDSLFLESTTGLRTYLVPESGAWVASAGIASLSFNKPQGWQETAGDRTPVEVRFVERSESRAGIEADSYDASRPLHIDVEVVTAFAAPPLGRFATDGSGNFYAAGRTDSEEVCRITTGGIALYCPEAIVAGFDPEGGPIFVTTLAGLAADWVGDIALNEGGELVVAGVTESKDFPVTADAFQPVNAGPLGPADPFNMMMDGDLFLARLDTRTGDLLYSTFFGGPQGEGDPHLAAGPGGVALTASTGGDDFPTTSGAWTAPPPPPCSNINCAFRAVVARFDASLQHLEYSTYLQGRLTFAQLAMHSDGSVYLAGIAPEGAFTTPGSLQPEFGGLYDAYLLRLAPDGSRPLFATYWGGSRSESADAFVLDEQGNVLLFVKATNERFSQEGASAQLVRIAADGSSLLSSWPLPAARFGSPHFVRTAEDVALFSRADSPVLPTSDDAPLRGGCGRQEHWYLMQWDRDGEVQLATYLPQQGDGSPLLASGTPGALYLYDNQSVERIDLHAPNEPAVHCVTGAASRKNFSSVSPGHVITLLGAGMGPEEGVGAAPTATPFGTGRYPQVLAGVRVWVDGVPAPLLYVQASQINAVVPYATLPVRNVFVEIEYEGRRLPLDVYVNHGWIDLFSLDGSGMGQAAALNQDGTLNSESNPAVRGSIVVLYGTGVGELNPMLPDGGLGPLSFDELARPIGLVQAAMDHTPADILYAGSAPGLVNGVAQFNLRVPLGLSLPEWTQRVALDVRINGAVPQNMVTIWVRE